MVKKVTTFRPSASSLLQPTDIVANMVAVSVRRKTRRTVTDDTGKAPSRASQGTAAGSKNLVQPTRVLRTTALDTEENISAEQSSRPRRVKAVTDYAQFFDNEADDGVYDRPARMTRTGRLNKVQLSAYEKNFNSSRLLRLPPELANESGNSFSAVGRITFGKIQPATVVSLGLSAIAETATT